MPSVTLGRGEAPLLETLWHMDYGGYAFAGLCLEGFSKTMWGGGGGVIVLCVDAIDVFCALGYSW